MAKGSEPASDGFLGCCKRSMGLGAERGNDACAFVSWGNPTRGTLWLGSLFSAEAAAGYLSACGELQVALSQESVPAEVT